MIQELNTKFMTYTCESTEEVYEVTKKLDSARLLPLHIKDGEIMKEVDNFKGVYNDGTGKFCSAVVPHYKIVQHKEYFDSFAKSLDNLNIKYKAEITQVGNRAFADFFFEGRNIIT